MGKYRIPDDEQVVAALDAVVRADKTVDSQRDLKRRVEAELRKAGDFHVGGPRLRHLALDSGLVRLQILCREAEEKARSLVKCPVCGTRLRRVRNMTVFGGTVTLGYRCPRCGYWTGLKRRIPTRYVFTRQ